METALVIAALLALLLAGLPVAIALLGMGVGLLALGGFNLALAASGLTSAMDNFVLLAVPLFVLMSNVMLKGGVGRDLFAAIQAWVGHWPGGLAVAAVISCGIFAAISGSSVATAATIGTVAIPEMTARGYPRPFVLGLVAAGGTLGILIPPSLIMIIYGVIMEESVLALFLAGVGPGLLLMALFIGWSMLYATLHPGWTAPPKADKETRLRLTKRAAPTAALSFFVILGIYQGWFTPTEAAAIGFGGALAVTTLVLRSLSWADFADAVRQSAVTTISILAIVAGAKVFGKAIALWRIPQEVTQWISAATDNADLFILAVAGVLLAMGLFMEALSMLLIMMPILASALGVYGVDPVWFGVFFVIMIECALITPPVGLNLYVIQSVGKAGMGEVSRGVTPFLLLMLLSVFLIWLFKDIALWLPFHL